MASNSGKSDSGMAGFNALTGQTIGDFEVLEAIGRGGMGVVLRARQISLDRIVALKILSSHLGLTEHSIARFRREAHATARLHHPNIVPIYAQGRQEQTYYYAMELVSGRSLHDIIASLRGDSTDSGGPAAGLLDLAFAETEPIDRKSPGSTTQVVPPEQPTISPDVAAQKLDPRQLGHYTESYLDEIAGQISAVADALDYAHRNGVIHRDIKPHNLLVGDGNRLCLSDFGLARVLEQPGVTVTGEFVGSPLYMSPEQITGRAGEVGRTTDIYSLGATLYEWLTLSPPFRGETREQVIARVISDDPVAPRVLNSRIPVDLETICLKALEKDPARRYQTAGEMRDDLRRFLDRSNIRARRAGAVASTIKFVSRRRVAATIVAAAVLVGALSLMLFRERRQVKETAQVVASKQEQVDAILEQNVKLQQERSEMAEMIADMIQNNLDLGRTFASAVKEGSVLSNLLSAPPDARNSYAPVTVAWRIGDMFVARMREAHAPSSPEGEPLAVAADPAQRHFIEALAADDAQQAQAHLDECLSIQSNHVDAWFLRAWIHARNSETDKMLADAEKILDLDSTHGEAGLIRAAAHFLAGDLAAARADLAAAETTTRRDHCFDVLTGVVLAGMGEVDQAMIALSRALTLNPNSILALLKRAELSLADGHIEHAIVDLSRVIELEPENAEALEARGEGYDMLKRYNDAFSDYFRALQITGRPGLIVKMGTAAANRDEMRLAREAEKAGEAKAGSEAADESAPQLTPPDGTSRLNDWLDRLLDRGKADDNPELRRSYVSSLHASLW